MKYGKIGIQTNAKSASSTSNQCNTQMIAAQRKTQRYELYDFMFFNFILQHFPFSFSNGSVFFCSKILLFYQHFSLKNIILFSN